MKSERIILGIDPGTNIMGYGLIFCKGKQIELISMGVIKLGKYENHAIKLKKIFEGTISLIKRHCPDELAIEAPFFGKNVQSMLKLGRAQGVAIAAALSMDLAIFEYSPKKIKQAVTGNGNASKEQVAAMLPHLLHRMEKDHALDATDGLAAAVCHFLQNNKTQNTETYSDWKSFLNKNPDRQV